MNEDLGENLGLLLCPNLERMVNYEQIFCDKSKKFS